MSVDVFVQPQTDEMKQIIRSVEKATKSKVILIGGMDKKCAERAQEAAVAAATIVFNDLNPDGAWCEEAKVVRDELIELCGLRSSIMFEVEPCRMQADEIEAALVWIREAFNAKKDGSSRALALSFMTWAAKASKTP